MKHWLLALCLKHSNKVLRWFECDAESIYAAVDQFEAALGRSIDGDTEWVDGTIIE